MTDAIHEDGASDGHDVTPVTPADRVAAREFDWQPSDRVVFQRELPGTRVR